MSAVITIVLFFIFAFVFLLLRSIGFTAGAWIGLILVALIAVVAFDSCPILLIAGIIKLFSKK